MPLESQTGAPDIAGQAPEATRKDAPNTLKEAFDGRRPDINLFIFLYSPLFSLMSLSIPP
jgi:hypothetical protein